MNKKGGIFSVDALLAATILALAIIIGSTFFIDKPSNEPLVNQAADLVGLLMETEAGSMANKNVQDARADLPPGIPFSTRLFSTISVAELIGYYWATGQTSKAAFILENVTSSLVNPIYNYAISIDGDVLYRRGSLEGENLASARRLVSGLAKQGPVSGNVGRARLAGIKDLLQYRHVYFGGFVGQATNISKKSVEIPLDATVIGMEMEVAVGANFMLFINGVLCKDVSDTTPNTFNPSTLGMPTRWNIESCKSSLSGGEDNIFEFKLVGNNPLIVNEYYITGGFIEIAFLDDSVNLVTYNKTEYIPAVTQGLPQIRSGFSVEGRLTNLALNLSYQYDHTIADDSTLFVVVGNITVYNDTASSGIKNIYISNLTKEFHEAKGDETIPYVIGIDNFNGIPPENINGRVAIALDTSEQYDGCVLDGYEAPKFNTSCSLPSGSDYCCAVKPDLSQTNCPEETCRNEVAIVDQGYTSWCRDNVIPTGIPNEYHVVFRFVAVEGSGSNSLGGNIDFSGCNQQDFVPIGLEAGDTITHGRTVFTSSSSVSLANPRSPNHQHFPKIYGVNTPSFSGGLGSFQFSFGFSSGTFANGTEMADFDGIVFELECDRSATVSITVDDPNLEHYSGETRIISDGVIVDNVTIGFSKENNIKSGMIRNATMYFANSLAVHDPLEVGLVASTGVGMPANLESPEPFSGDVVRYDQENWMVAYVEHCHSWRPRAGGAVCSTGTPTPFKLQTYNRVGSVLNSVSESSPGTYSAVGFNYEIPVFANEELFYRSDWAQFEGPSDVATDSGGNVYVADTGNNRIRMIDTSERVTTIVGGGAGGGTPCPGVVSSCQDGFGEDVEFDSPRAIAIDQNDVMYIADMANNRVRKLDLATGMVSTIGGNGNLGFPSNGANAMNQPIESPSGIAVDNLGVVYVSIDHAIVRLAPAGGVYDISVLAGSATAGVPSSTPNQPGPQARFDTPLGLTIDSSGSNEVILVADSRNDVIRSVETQNGLVNTIAGIPGGGSGFQGSSCGGVSSLTCNDGDAITQAVFLQPSDVAIDVNTNVVYILDRFNNCVRYKLANGFVGTLAGYCMPSAFGPSLGNDDGFLTQARFFLPKGLGIFSGVNPDLYVTTTGGLSQGLPDDLIRKIDDTGFVSTLSGGGIDGGICGSISEVTCEDSPTNPTFGSSNIHYRSNSGSINTVFNFDYSTRDDFLPLYTVPEDGILFFRQGAVQRANATIALHGFPDANKLVEPYSGFVSQGDMTKDLGLVDAIFSVPKTPVSRYEIQGITNPVVMIWVGTPTDYTRTVTYSENDHVYACLDRNLNSVCDWLELNTVPNSCPTTDTWSHPLNQNDVITTYHGSLDPTSIVYDPLDDGIVDVLYGVTPLTQIDSISQFLNDTEGWEFDCICCALHKAGEVIDSNYDPNNFGASPSAYGEDAREIVLVSDGNLGNVSCSPLFDDGSPEWSAYIAAARLSGTHQAPETQFSFPTGSVNNIPGFGMRVHVIGLGARRNDEVLRNISVYGNGTYQTVENEFELIKAFKNIRDEIRDRQINGQLLNYSSLLTNVASVFPESHFEVGIDPLYDTFFSEIPLSYVRNYTGTCDVSVDIPRYAKKILEVNSVSFSGLEWWLRAKVDGTDGYSIGNWFSELDRAGDPANVWLPPSLFTVGTVSDVNLTVGDESQISACSDKPWIHWKFTASTVSPTTPPLPNATGCNWDIHTAWGGVKQFTIPGSYTGTNQCWYKPMIGGVDIKYNANDSMQVSVANLLRQLDLYEDGEVDVDFMDIATEIENINIAGVPYLWGPFVLRVDVWQ